MEKCLVTKLKGTVNNDSLIKLGEIPFEVTGITTATVMKLGDFEYSLRSLDGKKFKVQGNQLTTEINNAWAPRIEFDNISSIKLAISPSDGLHGLSMDLWDAHDAVISVDMNTVFTYMNKTNNPYGYGFYRVESTSGFDIGKFSEISDNCKITGIYLIGENYYGDLSVFASKIFGVSDGFTSISFQNTKISGKLEHIITALKNSYQTGTKTIGIFVADCPNIDKTKEDGGTYPAYFRITITDGVVSIIQ